MAMNNKNEGLETSDESKANRFPERFPVDGVVAEFEHLGQDFRVSHETLNAKMNFSGYSILNYDGNITGYMSGLHRQVGESLNFTALRSDNLSKRYDDHIPRLVRTAIGEIVLQGELTWHSNTFLLPEGRRMYESLRTELEQEGTRFFGKLRMYRRVADNDGNPVVRYSIQKVRES